MNHADWLDCCAQISALWPHRPMPPEAAESWYPILADLDGHAVMQAIVAISAGPDATWPPSHPGQIRAAAEPPPRAWEDAMAELRRMVSRHGIYAPEVPATDDPALADVIGSYGWRESCNLDRADPTVRAQWRDAYRAAQATQRDRARRDLAIAATPNRQLNSERKANA